jgi:putative transposase
MLLAIGEYSRNSTEESINLMQSVIDRYSYIRDIGQVISDHGSEFVANKRDKHGHAKHRFELYCKENGIKQVLCRVKHPQTNGKLEKFFHIYDQRRWEFDSIEDFQHWYNYIRPHMSLDFDNLETPYQAFNDRLQDVFVGNYMEMLHAAGIKNRGEGNEVLS